MADSPELNSDGPLGLIVKVEGAAIADDLLIMSAWISNTLNRIPEAVFSVLSNSPQIEDFAALDDDTFKLGKEVEILAFYGDAEEQSLFKGIIVTTRARMNATSGLRIELTCRDKALQLTEQRSSEQYEEQKDSEVMSAVIGDVAGLTADVTATTNTATQLRVAASDWDFLRLLADRNGMVIAINAADVKITDPDMTLGPVLTVTYGVDIMEYDISVDAHRMIASAKTVAWSEATQAVEEGTYDTLTNNTLGNTTSANIATVLGDRAHLASTARELPSAELETYAKARIKRADLANVRGSVKFQGSGAITPLDMLEVADNGKRFGGEGFVSGVEHNIENGSWTTTAHLGLPPDWTSDEHGIAAPAAEALATPIHGLQIGKVIAVAEDEGGMLRIHVTLPMIGDPPVQVWARYAQPYASSEAGIMFLPEVDDEVLVSFLNSDPNAPIVMGSLHNANAARSEEATEDNFIKTIVSREKLKFTMDDEKKIITIETPGGHILTMDDDATTFSMEDMNGNSIVMDESGITMSSDGDITITAGGAVAIEATGDATVDGANVTCTGQQGFTGTGNASAKLSAGGQVTVEGAMVMIN